MQAGTTQAEVSYAYDNANRLTGVMQGAISNPIGLAGGDASLYSYAASNPVQFNDPSGNVLPLAIPVAEGLYALGAAEKPHPRGAESGPDGRSTKRYS